MNRKKLILVFLLFIFGSLSAGQMPEFTESVTFQENFPKFRMSDLKGKVVIVVFFQSWCPICNGWSPEFFRDVENAYGDNPNIILIALKVDGSLASANEYLKTRITPNKWIVGSDKNAEYYKLVNGKDELYKYALVDGLGEIKEIKAAGMYIPANGKKNFVLASKDFSNGYHLSRTLSADKKYDSAFDRSVQFAEMGLFREAIAESRKNAKNKDQKTQALELEEDIYQGALKKINSLKESFAKEDDPLRFTYFQSLRAMTNSLTGFKIHKDVMEAYSEIKNEAFLKKELQAEKVYFTLLTQLAKIPKKDLEATKAKYLAKIATDYPDTYYGRVAGGK